MHYFFNIQTTACDKARLNKALGPYAFPKIWTFWKRPFVASILGPNKNVPDNEVGLTSMKPCSV